MKIAVVGAGAMGSVYAGLLGSVGHEVWAIDRWREHVDAIRDHGLRVEGASGDRVVPIRATTDPAEAGAAELVILAAKAMDVEAAAEAARRLLGSGTLVLGVAGVWRGAGFTVRTFDDVQRLVWEKLVCNVASSGTCTVLGRTIGEVIGDAHAWSVAAGCAAEAFEVGRAADVRFGFDDPIAYVREFALKIPDARPSMLLDLEAERRLEIDFINGTIPRVGREVGVAAPFNEAITALVKALEGDGFGR
jgi:2-dehydropantoate 2-reductase